MTPPRDGDDWSPLDRFAPRRDDPPPAWSQQPDDGYYTDAPGLFTHDTVGGWGPPPPPAPPPAGPGRRRRGLWITLAVLLSVAVVGGLVAVAVVAAGGRPTATAAPDPTPPPAALPTVVPPTTTPATAPCPQPATLAGTSASLGPDGLRLGFAATPGCADGQVVTGATELRVQDGPVQVAGAALDLTATPLALGPGAAGSLTVLFPPGTFQVVPSQPSSTSLTASLASGAGPTPRDAPARATVTAGAPLPPPGDPAAAALLALQRQAAIDRPDVDARLAERWQPQISSKQAGLVVAGRTFDQQAVLADHLGLRLRYPDARLVYSGDWRSYRGTDFWVTLSGATFPDSGAALGWCGQQGFGPDDCVGVLLSHTQGPEGTFAGR